MLVFLMLVLVVPEGLWGTTGAGIGGELHGINLEEEDGKEGRSLPCFNDSSSSN